MMEPSTASEQLLKSCPMDVGQKIQEVVAQQLAKSGSQDDASMLSFEVERSFRELSLKSFEDPKGAARLVVALLRGLAWRKYADILRREQGRLRPSSCQWFQGIQGQGSYCQKTDPPTLLENPQQCPTLPCFEVMKDVPLEDSPPLVQKAESEHVIENEQIQKKFGEFLQKSPVLCELLCGVLAAEASEIGELKRRWSERFDVSLRTIENWRHRAETLFMSLYTGSFVQLGLFSLKKSEVVELRDFDPKHPLPSAPCAHGEIGKLLGLSRADVIECHQTGWRWMCDWMIDNGYPQARQLQLPIKESRES